MSLSEGASSTAERFARLPAKERKKILGDLSDEEIDGLRWDWKFWARPNQLPPEHDRWRTWLYLAGRGSGKTRSGAEWIRSIVCGRTPMAAGAYSRIALIGETRQDVREVMIEGVSGIMAVHPPGFRPLYNPSKGKLVWPNGAVAHCFNGTEPDQLRGPQFDAAWVDELAKIRLLQEVYDQLQLGLRLGVRPRQMITTTPRPLKKIRELLNDPLTHVTRGSSYDNAANLAPAYLNELRKKYEGTRLGRQEVYAEILDDNPYALWQASWIERTRIDVRPELKEVVVAIDPPVTTSGEADECGLIVAGKGYNDEFYVLADASQRGLSPSQWASMAVGLFYTWSADRIIAEANQGGDLVREVIQKHDMMSPVRTVRATKGKVTRAEPISALYEQERVHHVGRFDVLEDQMCDFTSDFDRKQMGYSPDRVDALVWALTDLAGRPYQDGPRVRML